MKRYVFLMLITVFLFSSHGYSSDDLQSVKEDEQAIWEGSGSQDATFHAISLSMLGWGVGLAGGIALLASAIHQSTASSHDSGGSSH